MADSMVDSMADHPVSMAYLLGDRATGCRVISVAGCREDRRLISSMFDISLPTDHPATAVTWRSVGVFVNRLVGMDLKGLVSYTDQTVLMHSDPIVVD